MVFFALTFLFQAMSAAVCFMIDGKYLLASLIWQDIVSTKCYYVQLVLLLKNTHINLLLESLLHECFYQSFDFCSSGISNSVYTIKGLNIASVSHAL